MEISGQPEAACPDCDARVTFDPVHAEMVCEAGHVVETMFVPMPLMYVDGRRLNPGNGPGLGSEFWLKDTSKMDLPTRQRFARMRNEQARVVAKKTDSKAAVVLVINGLGGRLGMSRVVIDTACDYTLRARKMGIGRGVPFLVAAAASLALASKVLGFPRPMKEIVAALPPMKHAKSRVETCRKKLFRILGLSVPQIDATRLIDVVLLKMELPASVGVEVRKALAQIGTGGSTYPNLGAAIYVSLIRLGIPQSQADVARAVGCSDPSIRSRLHRFPEFRGEGNVS
jgi:transcription initiation factor TFIIIB Brf1 subunit/transcription initiation factor TFIIB